MSLASLSVTPMGAVTKEVVITVERAAEVSWNWTSREVTMPTSLPPSNPVSGGRDYG